MLHPTMTVSIVLVTASTAVLTGLGGLWVTGFGFEGVGFRVEGSEFWRRRFRV